MKNTVLASVNFIRSFLATFIQVNYKLIYLLIFIVMVKSAFTPLHNKGSIHKDMIEINNLLGKVALYIYKNKIKETNKK